MITDDKIYWGSYGGYEGWWTPGTAGSPRVSPSDPPLRKYVRVLSASEGFFDAVNGYDSGGVSGGAIQLLEIPLGLLTPLLAYIMTSSREAWEPMAQRLGQVGGGLDQGTGKWLFYLSGADGKKTYITGEPLQRGFWLGCSGKKGSWTPEAKARQKAWIKAISNTLGHPAAVISQMQYLEPRMLQGALPWVKKSLLVELADSGWKAALQAVYVSYSLNNPAIAAEQLRIGLNGSTSYDDKDVALRTIKQLVWGSGIKIYPLRYGSKTNKGHGIRPVVEQLFGVDLPDFAEELKGDELSVLEVQTALKKAGYDPGPLDGIWGKKTASALQQFQAARGIKEDHVREETAKELRLHLE